MNADLMFEAAVRDTRVPKDWSTIASESGIPKPCEAHAYFERITRPKRMNMRWSQEELDVITTFIRRQRRSRINYKELQSLFPARSAKSIRAMADKIELSHEDDAVAMNSLESDIK